MSLSYRGALRLLDRRQETHVRLGLARLRRVLAHLDDPQDVFPVIHIAGTNGKGSVCAMLDSVLRTSGRRVGLYTSPHLHDVRERIRVDGAVISRDALARTFERVLRAERGELLTYFELMTAAAFLHFRDRRVDVAVLETGLGGRLDATNVVRHPLAAIVPAVGIDHTDWLGHDLGSIAYEKAGIFKRGAPAITAERKPAAWRVLRAAARRRGALWLPLPEHPAWGTRAVDWKRGRQRVSDGAGRELELGLLGEIQARNAALVAHSCRVLGARGFAVSDAALARGLAEARWPGRFELVRRGGRVAILDGAHNPQAMEQFCRTFDASPWASREVLFVIGALADKDYVSMLRRLGPRVRRAIATRPPSPRALDPEQLAAELRRASPRADVRVVEKPAEAVAAWRRESAPAVCVVGSFYLVAAARRALGVG